MNKQKTKHMRTDKNLDSLLNNSFSYGDEDVSKLAKRGDVSGGCGPSFPSLCGMKMNLTTCHVASLFLIVLAVLVYYKVMDNAVYNTLTTKEEWGPPDTVMFIAGVASVAINCWLTIQIKEHCPENCCTMVVMAISTSLLAIVFPYVLLYSNYQDGEGSANVKHAFWAIALALLMMIWVYFTSCACLSKCARTFLFVNLAWMLYVAIWLGTLISWNLF